MDNEQLLNLASDALSRLEDARENYFQRLTEEQNMKTDVQDIYQRLALQENNLDAPGGGRWNELKREIWINQEYDDILRKLDFRKDQTRIAYHALKQAEDYYEYVGRVIAIRTS